MDLKAYLAARAAEVDAAMDAFLPKAKERPATIHAAMRYSRLRRRQAPAPGALPRRRGSLRR